MSFPVADTLMIESTESENKREIDRFCEAMISIRREIAAVETWQADPDSNFLKNGPHTHRLLLPEEWAFPYAKREVFFPLSWICDDKYRPPVGRVDNLYGDRNLFCNCVPVENYADTIVP
ncbi:MAG: hypothetical protein HYY48_12810 [Gammaproteobacteria bacterium]|nr:hypothetical protein [Gammaproteobacteria bacterium]